MKSTITVRNLLALWLAALVASCGPAEKPPDSLVLSRVSYQTLQGWTEDSQGQALDAFGKSCARLIGLPDDRSIGAGGIAGTVADWRPACEALETVANGDAAARAYLERWFDPFAAFNNDQPEGLFTGYYEASLNGSRARTARYATPLHARPDDLVMVDLGEFRDHLKGERIAGRVSDGRLKPYEQRAEIVSGALDARDLEIVWVDNPVDAFFVQIQGSGRIALDDGSEIRVGYAGQNGHPYTAIGKVLIESGALTREAVSMQSIRIWLEANPGRADEVMNQNRSYVFFDVLDGDGPLGAQGIPLTAGRSIAVDRKFLPLSVPIWLDTVAPLPDGSGERPLRRLMIAQDTGGAIRGPVRGDVFWGHGSDAAAVAGRMKSPGRYYLLLPKTLSVPIAAL
jgi:membrane-bound lytic murein transglycosylase A